jgi:hypothetical protein
MRRRNPPALRDEAVSHPRVDACQHHRVEKIAGSGVGQPLHVHLGKSGQHVWTVTDGEDDRDWFGQQAPCHESHCLQGDLVEPLRIVHDAEQRLFGRCHGEQAQYGEPHQESVGSVPQPAAEGDVERRALRLGQFVEVAEQRRAQLLQPSERKLHIRLHADNAHDAEPVRTCRGVVE